MKKKMHNKKKGAPSSNSSAQPATRSEIPAAIENSSAHPQPAEQPAWVKNLEEAGARLRKKFGPPPPEPQKGIKVIASGTGFNTAGKAPAKKKPVDPELQKMADFFGLTPEDLVKMKQFYGSKRRRVV